MTPPEVLRERGWYQGWYESDDGAVCLLGARNVCATGNAQRDADVDEWETWADAVMDVIREQFPERGATSIHQFNDDGDTTEADVELVLEKAQIRLDEAAS